MCIDVFGRKVGIWHEKAMISKYQFVNKLNFDFMLYGWSLTRLKQLLFEVCLLKIWQNPEIIKVQRALTLKVA